MDLMDLPRFGVSGVLFESELKTGSRHRVT